MPVIQAIFFDVGQTILSPDYTFLQKLLGEFGVDTDCDKLAQSAALSREKKFRGKQKETWKGLFTFWLQAAGAQKEDIPELLKRIYARHQQENLWSWVEPTARKTFNLLLKMKYRLGIISNADGKVADVLNGIGLDHYFECIIDSHHVGVEKPDPKIFRAALDVLALEPANCLYVGDNYDRDIIGARSVGMEAVLLDPYDIVVEDDVVKIKELVDLIEYLKK